MSFFRRVQAAATGQMVYSTLPGGPRLDALRRQRVFVPLPGSTSSLESYRPAAEPRMMCRPEVAGGCRYHQPDNLDNVWRLPAGTTMYVYARDPHGRWSAPGLVFVRLDNADGDVGFMHPEELVPVGYAPSTGQQQPATTKGDVERAWLNWYASLSRRGASGAEIAQFRQQYDATYRAFYGAEAPPSGPPNPPAAVPPPAPAPTDRRERRRGRRMQPPQPAPAPAPVQQSQTPMAACRESFCRFISSDLQSVRLIPQGTAFRVYDRAPDGRTGPPIDPQNPGAGRLVYAVLESGVEGWVHPNEIRTLQTTAAGRAW